MKRISIVTFGCKVNQYESQALRESLAARGCEPVAPEEGPDVFIVNTCAVTETACKEAERVVRRLRRKHPRAEFVVTGCAAVHGLRLPGVRVIPQAAKPALPELLDGATSAAPSIFDMRISDFDGHTRAFLKVQDGCDLNCSFCVVPRVRGTSASRPVEDAVEEARRLVGRGFREIVVTGVHTGSFGRDTLGRGAVADLVRRLLDLPGLARVRLSSVEVNEVDDPLLDLMAAEPSRFCPHFHLPLQSGDDAVLGSMRRRYTAAQYEAAVDRIRSRVPEPGITTDVIVGYPTEAEDAFERTVDLCRRIGFSRIHIFPYSRREGTEAANLPDLPDAVKKGRLHRLETVAAELMQSFAERFVGREVEMLVEEEGRGYTERYVPARVSGLAPNTVARVRAIAAREGSLTCAA